MIILGIETSTAVCSAGLADETNCIAERSLVESHIHSEKILTLISEMCSEHKISIKKLDGIAISIGPGSFTGLRIGLSTAKGLCYAIGKPLVPVSTFTAVASGVLNLHPDKSKAIICVDAKQGEYYIGMYRKKDGIISDVIPVKVQNLSYVNALEPESAIIITDRTDEIRKLFLGSRLQVENILPYCRGDRIAFEATKKLLIGETNDWKNMEPMYLKDFVIRKPVN